MQLMPHQRTGGDFIASRAFALLLDDPGLGKTATAIHGADVAGCRKILVLSPAAVRPHWARSVATWQTIDRPVTVLEGLPKAAPGNGVTIASHDALARCPDAFRAGAPYDLIIVDEIHSFREWSAARTKVLCQPSDLQFINAQGRMETLPRGAWSWTARLWGLSGTPIVNSAADLFPLFYGPLRQPVTWFDFATRFCEKLVPSGSGEKPVGLKNAHELAERMRPFTLRRTLASVGIVLPPLTMQSSGFSLPPETMTTIMAGLENWSPERLMLALENSDNLTDANLMRVRRVLGTAKCLAVATWIWDQLVNKSSGPVVCFFHHTDVRIRLHEMLHGQCGFRVGWIDGKISPKNLTLTETAFQQGQYDVLLVQTQAGGQGITLHHSAVCCFAELPWTAMAVWQAAKRVHRIGQAKACAATVLKVNGFWLETVMSQIVTRKQIASETLLQLLTTSS